MESPTLSMSPGFYPDYLGQGETPDDDEHYEEYINPRLSTFPKRPYYSGFPSQSRITQTLLRAPMDATIKDLVYNQAELLDHFIYDDGRWAPFDKQQKIWLDDIQLCIEDVSHTLLRGDNKLDAPEVQYNLRNRDIVRRDKIIKANDPESLDIKPRRRGKPRRAPPGLQATTAVQTEVQIDATTST